MTKIKFCPEYTTSSHKYVKDPPTQFHTKQPKRSQSCIACIKQHPFSPFKKKKAFLQSTVSFKALSVET